MPCLQETVYGSEAGSPSRAQSPGAAAGGQHGSPSPQVERSGAAWQDGPRSAAASASDLPPQRSQRELEQVCSSDAFGVDFYHVRVDLPCNTVSATLRRAVLGKGSHTWTHLDA